LVLPVAYINTVCPGGFAARSKDMSVSPLRFTSSVRVGDVARAVVARDTARAQKFLAGTQPHGPIAHKTPELRRRGAVAGKDSHGDSRGHAQVNLADDGKVVDDTIDVTDAGLLVISSPHLSRY
jgi:hypothetical protein